MILTTGRFSWDAVAGAGFVDLRRCFGAGHDLTLETLLNEEEDEIPDAV